MLKKGMLVRGTKRTRGKYSYTTEEALCIVDEVLNTERMRVTIVAHNYGDRCTNTPVDIERFEPCSYEKFISIYPNATLVSGYTAEELSKIKSDEIMEEEKMGLRMNKEKYGAYELTDEERETLRTDIMELLEEYDYNPTEDAVDKIIDEWVKNKGWLINLFKQHPNYNGKFQIAFDTDFARSCDKGILNDFRRYLSNTATELLLKEKQIGVFSYREIIKYYQRLIYIRRAFNSLDENGYHISKAEQDRIYAEYLKWDSKIKEYKDAENKGIVYLTDYHSYDYEQLQLKNNIVSFSDLLYENREQLATEEFAERVNGWFPSVKAVAGQKVSRIVGKVAKLAGIDKDASWNREFAKFSDTINPLTIKRHTILSLHPIDYFTMSFGNSWASCHTIDKSNKRGMPNDYSGCYSSGTMSYMLDGSSFVFYTVDKEYNGNKLELQDKINRNMFHMGEDKLIQARVYPQATDGETGIYKQIREIAQKVISDCLGAPNMWKNVKGTSECDDMIYSEGTHYRDYTNFSDCNVSYLKTEGTDEINREIITVGHDPICPNCGYSHSWAEAIECRDCYEDGKVCYDCGCRGDDEDMHYIDGEWYCEDCCFYCEYHEEWEVGESTYIEDYGRVCDDALDYADFYFCEYCDEWHCIHSRRDEHIETEDGRHFCCCDCASNAGYIGLDDGNWYPEDEVYYCEHCETHVHVDDWNDEQDCCVDCEDEVAANMEEEAV